MAVTQQKSLQITNSETRPIILAATTDSHGRQRVARFDFSQTVAAGDATSQAELHDLPAGRLRLLEIVYSVSALGAARLLAFGHLGLVDGNTVTVADPDAFAAAIDASAAVKGRVLVDQLVVSDLAVRLTAQVTGGTLPVGATLSGWATYVQD